MAPVWLTVIAWVYLSICFCCAGIIAYDMIFNHRRQPMGVMNFVFPITALYFGPLALALYWRWDEPRPAAAMAPAPMSMAPASGWRMHLLVTGCRPAMTSTLILSRLSQLSLVARPSPHRRASRTGHGGSRWPSR